MLSRHDVNHPILERLRDCCERGATARDLVVERVEFQGADLEGLRVDNLTLTEVDLRDATLRGSEWVDCRLSDVRLDRAIADAVIVRMCVLESVRAVEAQLAGAKLENTQAVGIVLDRANLEGGSLIDSDLTRASLRDANLRQVDATGATLRGADLRGADLRDAVLIDADLRGADLTNAILDGADLDGADLRGTVTEGDAGEDRFVREPIPRVEMPPELAGLAQAVVPTVLDILQRGNRRGVIDDETLGRLLDDLNKRGGPTPDTAQSLLAAEGPMADILGRINEVGIAPLLAALQQGGDEPPPVVAQMIRNLMGDAKLGPDATTEDLVVHLVKQVQSTVASRGVPK